MPLYLITYLGGNPPATPEEGQQHFAKYQEWLNSLGEAAIIPANPLKDTNTIKPDATITPVSTTNMSGYTVIKSDTMDEALTQAKACPFLDIGGSLEVSEIVEMQSG